MYIFISFFKKIKKNNIISDIPVDNSKYAKYLQKIRKKHVLHNVFQTKSIVFQQYIYYNLKNHKKFSKPFKKRYAFHTHNIRMLYVYDTYYIRTLCVSFFQAFRHKNQNQSKKHYFTY